MDLSALNGTNGFALNGEAASEFAGSQVSAAGDVNGDGFGDVIIAARAADYVVFGKASGFDSTIDLATLNGTGGFRLTDASGNNYNHAVSAAGDVNGDGVDDLIIGDWGAGPHGTFSGSAYVMFGKVDEFGATVNLATLDGTSGFRLDGVAGGDYAGHAVSSAGDVNGDGFDDLIIGAVGAGAGDLRYSPGAAYVVFGKASGFPSSIDLSTLNGTSGFRLAGVAGEDFLGQKNAAASAGDVNGDGFDDLIIGANGADPDGIASGAAYVVFGKSDGFAATINLSALDGTNGFRLDGVAAGDRAGVSVSSAGDVNADGFDDLIVGARDADAAGDSSGAAYVVFGKAGGFASTSDLSSLDGATGFRISGEAAGDHLGHSVSAVGDVNGDGYDDLIVGAMYAGSGDAGAAYVVFGRAGGFASILDLSTLDSTTGFRLDGEIASDLAGYDVSGAGDVNGDGVDDLVIGAHLADPNGNHSGTGYVVFGVDDSDVVEGTSGNDSMTGDGDANSIDAGLGDDTLDGAGGADLLDGGGGNDLLIGGAGDDQLSGGLGSDTVSYEAELAAVSVDLAIGTAGGTSAGDDLLNGIEDVVGSAFSDTLAGNSASNLLDGGAGDDTLTGGAAGDVFRIAAGNGTDHITDFSGQDVIDVPGIALVEPVTDGDGSAVLAGEVQVSSSDGITTLHIGVDANAGADVTVLLSGTFGASDLLIVNGDIGTDIAAPNTPPVAGSIPDVNASEGVAFDFTVPGGAFVDADPGDVLTYSATLADGSDLPSWLAFDPETRTFSGVPEGATITVKVTATDEASASASALFDIFVASTADLVTGTPFAEVLDGGIGADTMRGLGGNDTYIVDNTGDVVIEDPLDLTGTDQVQSSVTFTLSGNLEHLILTGSAAINGTGNILSNRIFGNSAANRLDGALNDDILTGGDGDDTYVVDNPNDIVEEAEDEGNDLVQSSVTYSLADAPNVERLSLTAAGHTSATGNTMANTLTGNSGNNTLMGEDDDDTLVGGAGNDTLDGGAGADSMAGQAGNDVYYVENVLDVVVEGASAGADEVRSSVTFTLGANVEHLFLTGDDAIDGAGNSLSNQLTGNTASNVLTGGAGGDLLKGWDIAAGTTGADTLIGGTGNDVYYVDSADDVVIELAGSGQGIDRIYTTVNLTLPDNVEHVTVVDTYALFIVGNGLNNSFQGEDGHDNLNGGSGNDTLDGGLGNDTLQGGTGNDSLKGGGGNDVYFVNEAGDVVVEVGGQGTDMVRTVRDYTLAANVENGVLLGAGDINGIGNSLNNSMSGNSGKNEISGGGGGDTLNGGSGKDLVRGDSGNDLILGGDGDDQLAGGTGADHLAGGTGGDTMSGGFGSDIYEVDDLGDVVVETSNSPGGLVIPGGGGGPGKLDAGGIIDGVIASLNYSLEGLLFVENLTLSGSALRGTGNALTNVMTGNAHGNTMSGGDGNDTLNGAGGVDSVRGDAGNDTLVWASNDALLDGGAGTDTLRVDGANVTLDARAVANTKIKNVEVINITGTGANELILDLSAVLDLSSTSNSLRIDGNSGDVLHRGAGWIGGSITGGYRSYFNGPATLLVDTDITSIV